MFGTNYENLFLSLLTGRKRYIFPRRMITELEFSDT